jgi:DNA-binding IclR family transcriptional regulator
VSAQAVERDTSLRSVIKSFDLIEALIEQGEATASELAVLVGEPRSSVYRMLATLQQIEIVEVGSRRGLYRPGLGLVRLCGAVLTRFDERQLVMRRGFQAVFIERLPGEHLHTLAVKLGGVLPLHVGAAPRALLAFEPDAFRDEYFAAVPLEPWTPKTPTREAEVRDLLDEVRRTGVSFSDGDVVNGVATVGVPVFDHRGAVCAAIAFNLMPDALHRDRDAYAELGRGASIEASRAFGYDLAANGLPVSS